jgi:hypothetical protein
MEESTTIIIQVANSKLKAFFYFLQVIDFVQIKAQFAGLDFTEEEESFVAGDFNERENPLQKFAGIWKDNDITLEQIRKQAWQRTR